MTIISSCNLVLYILEVEQYNMYDKRYFISDSTIDEENDRNEARHKKMPETQIKKIII